MRVFIFLSFLSVATALFDAIIWEAESWYKAYLMERLLYPDDKSQWQICKSCKLWLIQSVTHGVPVMLIIRQVRSLTD